MGRIFRYPTQRRYYKGMGGYYDNHDDAVSAVADILIKHERFSDFTARREADSDVSAAEDECTYQDAMVYVTCASSTSYYVMEMPS
jgi:hypothetical protein